MKLIYFLRPVGQLGPIKIGCSKLPALRLETLTTWSPVRLELICSVPGTHKDERTLHGMFAKHHVHGEWFGASKDLLALIDHCEKTGELPALPEVVKFPRIRHVGHKGRAAGKREPGELPSGKMELARILRSQYESGIPVTQLASEHGRAPGTITKYIVAAGGAVKRGPMHARKGVIDEARANDFRDRYLGGETLQQIAADYGVTRERVRQVLRKSNVPSLGHRPEHCRQPHELTAVERRGADLYRNGTSPREIRARTGLTTNELYGALRRLGIERRGPGFWLTRPDDAEITARVCDLYRKGFSAPQIVSRVAQIKFPGTVYRYLKKGGVSPRMRRGGNRAHPRPQAAA